jgi:hybrid cluster-associated redox disulfide protein
MTIESTHLVDDVMRRSPATIHVFLNHAMHCVGCPIGCFHTVEDACREHAVDLAEFLADLREAVQSERGAQRHSSTAILTD